LESESAKRISADFGKVANKVGFLRKTNMLNHILLNHPIHMKKSKKIVITPEMQTEHFKKNAPLIVEYISQICNSVFKEKININIEEESISIMNGTITLSVEIGETKRIGGSMPIMEWSVIIWEHVRGDRDTPDDVADIGVGTAIDNGTAAGLAIKAIAKVLVDITLDKLSDEAYARQFAEEKAMGLL
jgi:hypothetical protein